MLEALNATFILELNSFEAELRSSAHTGFYQYRADSSTIRDQLKVCNSKVNTKDFSILFCVPNILDFHLLESLYIHKLKPFINNQTSAEPLDIFFESV